MSRRMKQLPSVVGMIRELLKKEREEKGIKGFVFLDWHGCDSDKPRTPQHVQCGIQPLWPQSHCQCSDLNSSSVFPLLFQPGKSISSSMQSFRKGYFSLSLFKLCLCCPRSLQAVSSSLLPSTFPFPRSVPFSSIFLKSLVLSFPYA